MAKEYPDVELAHQILSNNCRGERMRREITTLVDAMQDVTKPEDSEAFANVLVTSLLISRGSDQTLDNDAAQAVYGKFAKTFRQHEWKDCLLRGVGYRTILAAACAADMNEHITKTVA